MKIFIKTKKFISIITTLCLLISFVIGPTAANAMTNEEATAKYKQIFKDFMLPYNYGQITSAHYAGTDRVIINIQDLHCHPKVQQNISNIIEIFDKSFGVKNVYLEGVYGKLSTKWLSDRIEPAKKSEILGKMLDTGRLTGAEYYSLMSGKTEIISGLEEKGPYLENLKRFGEIVENQDKINLILNAMDESLSKVKKQYYTKRQYKLEDLSRKYREGTITPQKYYALLIKHTDKLGIDLSKYENTFTYMTLLEMQKTLDYSKITNELQNLILLLRENLANSAYQMLVDNTENFSKIDKLYGYIVRISRELGLDLTVNFPNLDNYFGYIEFSQKINPLELIVEEKRLTEEINIRFSETKSQREIVFLTNFEKYVRDYVSSKITSDDYEYYKENIDIFRQLWNKYVDNKVLSLLDEYIAEADKFYKINTDRNIYFTDNMFTKESVLGKIENEVEAKGDVNKIIENMKGVKEVDVVITGGFHSQTVTEILKNQGVSYIVITPNVTDGVKLAEETYYEIAKEQSKISFQTLATLPFSAYSEDIRLKAAVMAFGIDIAKELFPNRAAEIDTINLSQKDEQTAKEISEQMKKLRRKIEESKFLESDDNDFIGFLNKISGEEVGEDLSEYISLKDIEEVLTDISINDRAAAIKNVIKDAQRDMNSSEINRITRKAIKKIKIKFIKATDRFRSQKKFLQKQELIRQIKEIEISSVDPKILDGLKKEDSDKLKIFESRRIESLSLDELKEYLNIKEKIITEAKKGISDKEAETTEEQVSQEQAGQQASVEQPKEQKQEESPATQQVTEQKTPEESQSSALSDELAEPQKPRELAFQELIDLLGINEIENDSKILEKYNEKIGKNKNIYEEDIKFVLENRDIFKMKIFDSVMIDVNRMDFFFSIVSLLRDKGYSFDTGTYKRIVWLIELLISSKGEGKIEFIPSLENNEDIKNLISKFFDLSERNKQKIYEVIDQDHSKHIPNTFNLMVNAAYDCEKGKCSEEEIDYILKALSGNRLYLDFVDTDIFYYFKGKNLNIRNLRFYMEHRVKSKLTPPFSLWLSIFYSDLDANSLLNDDIRIQELLDLMKNLKDNKINILDTEYNGLTLKILFNKTFRKTIQIQYRMEGRKLSVLREYRVAQKIARTLYDNMGEKILDLTEDDLNKIMQYLVRDNANRRKEGTGIKIVSQKTGIVAIHNKEKNADGERRFSIKGIEKILDLLGLEKEQIIINDIVIKDDDDIEKMAEKWLKSIENLAELLEENDLDSIRYIFDGHGGEEGLFLLGNEFGEQLNAVVENLFTHMTVDQVAEALFVAYKKCREKGEKEGDIEKWVKRFENSILDLSSCNSYVFSKKNLIMDKLAELEEKEGLPLRFPVIITEAGKETKLGYSTTYENKTTGEKFQLSNMEYSLIRYLEDKIRDGNGQLPNDVNIADLFDAEIYLSNHTIFISNDKIEKLNTDLRKYISETLGEDFIFKEEQEKSDVTTDTRLSDRSTELTTTKNKKRLEWLENKLGIKENSKIGQIIISLLEDWRIVLGIFFPGVRDKFIREHEQDVSEELNKTINSVDILKHAAENVPANRVVKVFIALSILLNPIARVQLAKAHMDWNKKQLEMDKATSSLQETQQEQAETKKGFFGRLFSNLFSSRKSKATTLFKEDEDGNIYIIVDKGEGKQYLLTFNHRFNRIYVSSVNDVETNDFFSKDTSQYTSVEDIESFLNLKINVSNHSITVKSTDSIADIQIIKQENISDTVSKLKGRSVVKQDEGVLDFLKEKLNIKNDKNVETVFMDESEGQIQKKIEGLMSEGEEDKLLVIYPLSQVYNTTDIRQLFSLYFNFAKNLRDIFGLKWFPSFKSKDKESENEVQTFGTLILLEFVKNAIVHGNLADLSKPIYIKYGKDKDGRYGFTVYNVYHKETKKSRTKEEKLRLVLSTMVGLSGAHEGLSHIRKAESDDIVSNLHQEDIEIKGMEDTYLYSISVSQSDDMGNRLKERRKRQQERGNVVRTISVKDLLEKHIGNCVLHVEQADGSIATILFSSMSEESAQISVLYQMLPDGTVVDMKGKNLTLDEINTQFNINITIDTNKDTGERYITVQNKERNGAKSISPFVSFANAKEIVAEIKKSKLPENALSLEDLIEKLKRLGELKGEETLEEKQELEKELKQKTLVVYPYYLGYDVTELTNEQIDALYIYISNLLNSITPELLNGDEELAHSLKETLKNAFLHGNLLNPNTPIYIQFNELLNHFDVYNKVEKRADYLKSQKKYRKMSYFATRTNLFGGTHQFYSTYLQGQYKDILDSAIEEKDINGETYYKVSIGRKGTEAPKEVEQEEQTTQQTETKPEKISQVEQDHQQETQPDQQELSHVQKTKIISDIIDDICREVEKDYKITNLSLPEEMNNVIEEIIESIEKEDKISFLQRDRIKRLIIDEKQSYLTPIYDFAIKQKNLQEQLRYLQINGQQFASIFYETKEKWLNGDIRADNEEEFFNIMREVAEYSFYDLIDFLEDKNEERKKRSTAYYKIYEIEQILENFGLIEAQLEPDERVIRNIGKILDTAAEEKILQGTQTAQQQAQPEEREYESIVELEKAGIHPIANIIIWAMGLVDQLFKNDIKFEGKIILIEEGREIEVPNDITKVTYKIDTQKSDIMFGTVIGVIDGRTVRVKKQGNSMTFYSKAEKGLDGISESQIEDLFMEAFSSGIRADSVKIGSAIAFAKASDKTYADIQNRLANAAINGMQKAEVPASLDLSGIENIGGNFINKCKEATNNGQSSTIIIINAKQLEKYGSEIAGLRADGFRFILRGNFDVIDNAFKGNIYLDGAILEKAERKHLEQLENIAADNVEGKLHIETQMYINMTTAKEFIDINEIYNNNGIIPIVNAAQAESMTGKYAIGYEDIIKDKSDEEIKSILSTMLSGGNLANILCTEGKENQLENLRQKLAGIFSNMFGTMNELLKPKSPEQRISEETTVVSDYNFDEDFGNKKTTIINDLVTGGIIKSILTTSDTTTLENMMKDLQDSIKDAEKGKSLSGEKVKLYEMYEQLPPVIKMRIQTQLDRGNYFETIGTIRGTVNQIIDSFVLGQSAFEESDQTKLRDKFLKKEYKEYRQYVRIKAIQLVMAGVNLSALLELRPDTNQTVEQLFDAIRTELNKDVRKTIIANKTAIKEIDTKEIENAKTNLMNVNILLDDSLRDKLVVTKQLEISAQTVRSILAAA